MSFDWLKEENIEKLTEEQAKFIFNQAEKFLKGVCDSNAVVVNRTSALLTMTVGIILALNGYLFSRITIAENIFDIRLITCIITLSYVYGLCWLMAKNLKPQLQYTAGAEPKKLFVDEFFEDEISDNRMKIYYVNELAICQKNWQRCRNW